MSSDDRGHQKILEPSVDDQGPPPTEEMGLPGPTYGCQRSSQGRVKGPMMWNSGQPLVRECCNRWDRIPPGVVEEGHLLD